MDLKVASSLIFQTSIRNPVAIRDRIDVADFVGTGDRIPPPSARIWRDSLNQFNLECIEGQQISINGKSTLARPLRDGDEIVAGNTVAIFRQAPFQADLDDGLEWDKLLLPSELEFGSDARRVFDTILLNSGLPRDPLSESTVEDWRAIPILGPHFGFGRVRSFHLDAGLSFGLDHSRWDVVGSGKPTLMRHRLVSVGLPGAVVKWELSRRSRDHGSPFVHDLLVIGWKVELVRRTVQQAVRSRFGTGAQFGPVDDRSLWSLHHTDRILGLPGRPGRSPDEGIYSTISRF